MITNQQIFDKSYLNLVKQGGPSYDGENCLYLDPISNNRCAVGHLVPDVTVLSRFEGEKASFILANSPDLNEFLGDDVSFLNNLQSCHDKPAEITETNRDWLVSFKARMKDLALNYCLTFSK